MQNCMPNSNSTESHCQSLRLQAPNVSELLSQSYSAQQILQMLPICISAHDECERFFFNFGARVLIAGLVWIVVASGKVICVASGPFILFCSFCCAVIPSADCWKGKDLQIHQNQWFWDILSRCRPSSSKLFLSVCFSSIISSVPN